MTTKTPQQPKHKKKPHQTQSYSDVFDTSKDKNTVTPAVYPKPSLGTLLFSVLGTILLIQVSLIGSPLPLIFPSETSVMFYSAQVPVVILLGALLGPTWGALSVILYIIVGLFFLPVFSSGGGLGYIEEPSIFYLIGLIGGAIMSGKAFKRAFLSNSVYKQHFYHVYAVIISVLTIHCVGLIGLLSTMIIGRSWESFTHWVHQLSVAPLPYDLTVALTLSTGLIWLRGLLWLQRVDLKEV